MKAPPARAPDSVPAPVTPARDVRSVVRTYPALLVVAVGGALAASVVLRFFTKSDLWLDEALTVNIARLPLRRLHIALRHDGAPPLHYVLLHGWMTLFGTSDLAVRALSGVLGVLMLPLAFAAGHRLGAGAGAGAERRRWAAWSTLLVLASSPFAIRYSTEARMYMLAMLVVLGGYLATTRALERPTAGRLAVVALTTAALLYTQYWGVYLVIVVGAAFAWRSWRAPAPERPPARRVLAAAAAGCVLFVPWLPTFVYQLRHTGTPWSGPTVPPTAAALGLLDFAGGRFPTGNPEGWALLLVLLLLALAALWGRALDGWHLELDLRSRPGVRWEWLVGAATFALGVTLSYLGHSAFQGRYGSVAFPFFVLAVGYGVTVLGDRRLRVAVLVVVVAIGLVAGVRNGVTNRTQAAQVVARIAAGARPGDVVAYCPDQVAPDASRLVPRRLALVQVAWPHRAGRFGDPRFVDWVDYADRNRRASAAEFARALLERARAHTVWYVSASGYRTYGTRCEEVATYLAAARPRAETLVQPDDTILEFMGLTRFSS